MSSIDLLDFTNTKKKIPQELLHEKRDHELNIFKIITSHFHDAMMIFQTTIIISFIFQLSLKPLMISKNLLAAFESLPFLAMSLWTIPIVSFSYYFFSFFFNHGQTWGMHAMKIRIEMKELSFKDSFNWAARLTFMTLSGGFLIFAFYPQLRAWLKIHFKAHDHLYNALISHKDLSPINLIKEIDQIHQMEEPLDLEISRAA